MLPLGALTVLDVTLTVDYVVVHLVVGPHPALVAVRVHAVVHVVDVRALDVSVHVHVVEKLRVGPSFGGEGE